MPKRPTVSRSRRPATGRGEQVVERVTRAARSLLETRWLDTVSVSELARESDIVRASLLLQFPNGLLDVVAHLLFDEWMHIASHADELAGDSDRGSTAETVLALLDHVFERAEGTGLLYANLRSQSFVVGEDSIGYGDVFLFLRDELEKTAVSGKKELCHAVADCLLKYAFDLAAEPDSTNWTFDQRRAALRTVIGVSVAGLAEQ